MTETITAVLMIVCAMVLVVWDVYVAFFNDIPNERDTESGIFRRAGRAFVAIPIAWGALGGHFWGPSHDLFGKWSPLYLIAATVALTGVHFILRRFLKIPAWSALVYFILGIPMGAMLWPQ